MKYDMKKLAEQIKDLDAKTAGGTSFHGWLFGHNPEDDAFWNRPFGAIMTEYVNYIDPPVSAYQKLLEWAKTQGKTERDLLRWWAAADYDAVQDMTTDEFTEWALEGYKVDREYVQNHWDDLDEETRTNYKIYMLDAWKGKETT